MFSLIISIIAIALVVATIAATMYYGGDALNQGTNKAKAAAIVSGAQQLSGAWQLHTVEKGVTPTLGPGGLPDALVTTGYLTVLPSPLGDGTNFLVTSAAGVDTLNLAGVPTEVCAVLTAQSSTQYTCAAGAFTYKL